MHRLVSVCWGVAVIHHRRYVSMEAALFWAGSVARALLRVDGQRHHQRAQCVVGVIHIDDVCVRHVQQLLADRGHLVAVCASDGVVPLQPFAVDLPAVAVDGKPGGDQRELLADAAHVRIPTIQLKRGQKVEQLLLHGAHVPPLRVQNVQPVAQRQLALHGVAGVAVLVIDVVAVQPGKQALFEQQFQVSSLRTCRASAQDDSIIVHVCGTVKGSAPKTAKKPPGCRFHRPPGGCSEFGEHVVDPATPLHEYEAQDALEHVGQLNDQIQRDDGQGCEARQHERQRYGHGPHEAAVEYECDEHLAAGAQREVAAVDEAPHRHARHEDQDELRCQVAVIHVTGL